MCCYECVFASSAWLRNRHAPSSAPLRRFQTGSCPRCCTGFRPSCRASAGVAARYDYNPPAGRHPFIPLYDFSTVPRAVCFMRPARKLIIKSGHQNRNSWRYAGIILFKANTDFRRAIFNAGKLSIPPPSNISGCASRHGVRFHHFLRAPPLSLP